MSPRIFARFATALLTVSVTLHSAPASEDAATPTNFKQDLESVGVTTLTPSKRVAIPTLYVKMMQWGRMAPVPHPDSANNSGSKKDRGTRPMLEMGVAIDPKVLQEIARELYQDLVLQLRASGWEVITFRDLSTSTALFRLEQEEVDTNSGAVVDTTSPTKEKRRYSKIAPENMPVLKTGDGPGISWLGKVAEEQGVLILVPSYVFDPVAFEAAAQPSGATTLAPLGERASLQLVYAAFDFVDPKSNSGLIRTRSPVQLWADIGSLAPPAEKGPEVAYALPKRFAADAIKKKVFYLLRPDLPALAHCVTDGAKEFNRAAVHSAVALLRK